VWYNKDRRDGWHYMDAVRVEFSGVSFFIPFFWREDYF